MEEHQEGVEPQRRVDLSDLFRPPHAVRSFSITGLFVLAVFFTLYFAQSLIIPIILAVLLSILLRPMVRAAERVRIPAPAGALATVLLVVGVIAVPFFMLAAPTREWMSNAPEAIDEVRSKIAPLTRHIEQMSEATERVEEATGLREPFQQEVVQAGRPKVLAMAMGQAKFIAGLLTVLVLLFFLLAYSDVFLRKLISVTPTFENKRRAVEIVRDIEFQISRFLRTVTLINIGLGGAVGLSLWALGMPNPLLWGVLAGVLNYVPYLGFMIGVAVVTLAAIFSFDNLGEALMCPLAYVGLNALEANVITPMLVGRSLSLNPVVIFMSVLLWGWMWGVAGALLAVPILAAFRIVCDHVKQLKPIGEFLGR